MRTIALIGNPNSGKTTLFNVLTGENQKEGNWSGVTVTQKEGVCFVKNTRVRIIDLPGVYTLAAPTLATPLDQRLTYDTLRDTSFGVVLQVIDATQLARHLYLTIQLRERGIPVIIALNMMDICAQHQQRLDVDALSAAIGCPVIPISAARREGLSVLRAALVAVHMPLPFTHIRYPKHIEVPLRPEIENDVDTDLEIAQARYQWIDALCARVQLPVIHERATDRLDRVFLHVVWGIPAFIGIMFLLFFMTIQIGGALQPWFEQGTRVWVVDAAIQVLRGWGGAFEWAAFLVAGLGLGLVTVVTFIPVIGMLFLLLTFLEDCGYMARASFVMDQAMRRIGLPGQSLVPLILGLGCNVPAVMAVRTLSSPRDRLLTVMMLPFMSCGARLAIYAIFVAAFFPRTGTFVVLGLYLLGICAALLTAFLLRKTMLIEMATPLIQALPAYRWPRWRSLYRQTKHRIWSFISRASIVILPLCVVLHTLNAVGTDGTWVWEGAHPQALLSVVGKALTPLVMPMGITAENWPATVGLLTGVLAKEVVIGTLNTLYVPMGAVTGDPTAPFFAAMTHYFDGGIGAFAYLLFILLYMPCVSTVSAISKEIGSRWAIWSVFWTTGLAYGAAVGFYQAATFFRHPWTSSAWVLGILCIGMLSMRIFSKRMRAMRALPTPIILR